jgi:hypothetical protein
MRMRDTILAAVVGAGLLGAGPAAAQQPHAEKASRPRELRVANTAADPVPVVGSVGIDPDNNTVFITNAPNTPTFVRDVDAPTAQPFRVELVVSFNPASPSAQANVLAEVPDAKRLVIDHVSARLFEAPASSFYVAVAEQLPSATSTNYWFPGRELGPASSSLALYMVSEQTRLAFEPGSRVYVQCQRGQVGTMPARGLSVTVSGYFVDVP